MTLALLVRDGALTVVHSLYAAEEPWMTSDYDIVDVTSVAGIEAGWHQNTDGSFGAPVSVPAVPASISRRQFYQQLAAGGDIAQADAVAAMAGTIPAKLAAAITTLPAEQQFAAQMLTSGATDFLRANPLVADVGAALGKTGAQLDALWLAAAKL